MATIRNPSQPTTCLGWMGCIQKTLVFCVVFPTNFLQLVGEFTGFRTVEASTGCFWGVFWCFWSRSPPSESHLWGRGSRSCGSSSSRTPGTGTGCPWRLEVRIKWLGINGLYHIYITYLYFQDIYSSWWLNKPIWNIWYSQIGSFCQVAVKEKSLKKSPPRYIAVIIHFKNSDREASTTIYTPWKLVGQRVIIESFARYIMKFMKLGNFCFQNIWLAGCSTLSVELDGAWENVNFSAPVTSSNLPNQLDVLLKHLNVVFSDNFLCFYLPLFLFTTLQIYTTCSSIKAFSRQFCQTKTTNEHFTLWKTGDSFPHLDSLHLVHDIHLVQIINKSPEPRKIKSPTLHWILAV